jgi:nitrite reductase/ring-hydroxylating ferredoxin subunit
MTSAGSSGRRLRRYVADLLRGRRPRPFPVSDDEAAQILTAITLRAARPGATAPHEDFLSRLHRRLEVELGDGSAPAGELLRRPGTRRRLIATAAAAAVAGVAGGAALDRVLVDDEGGPVDDGTLRPNIGVWHTVAASADLPDGAVRGFNVGTVIGFVQRVDGRVRAVSGTCSHQGCLLNLDEADRELRCPCHNAAFGLTGKVLRYQLATPPPTLPEIAAREIAGQVQIFGPA